MTNKKQAKNKTVEAVVDKKTLNTFDEKFKTEWILKNKKLAIAWARKYAFSYQMQTHLDDMIQAGIEGLLRGLEKYDGTRGDAKISTICSLWARAGIQKYIKENRYSFSVPIKHKDLPSFSEVEENTLESDDIATHIEDSDSREDHDLYEYIKILSPLQRKCFLYDSKLVDTIDKKCSPIIRILADTAKMKLKHFYKLEN